MDQNEKYLTVSQAAHCFPGRPSLVTIWRWMKRGVRGGIKLHSIAVGGRRLIPESAIAEFMEACSRQSAGQSSGPAPRTNRQRDAAVKRAEAELTRAGI